eukprot:scaffold482_cov266-Amphora_coffeaeformis.AAC.44
MNGQGSHLQQQQHVGSKNDHDESFPPANSVDSGTSQQQEGLLTFNEESVTFQTVAITHLRDGKTPREQ